MGFCPLNILDFTVVAWLICSVDMSELWSVEPRELVVWSRNEFFGLLSHIHWHLGRGKGASLALKGIIYRAYTRSVNLHLMCGSDTGSVKVGRVIWRGTSGGSDWEKSGFRVKVFRPAVKQFHRECFERILKYFGKESKLVSVKEWVLGRWSNLASMF